MPPVLLCSHGFGRWQVILFKTAPHATAVPVPLPPAFPCCSLSSLLPSAVFEELPINFHNSALAQALLIDIAGGPGSSLPLAAPATLARATGTSTGTERSVGAAPLAGTLAAASVIVPGADVEVDFSRLDLTTAPFLEKV